ncbi:class I SAM-dependent methyltransferase [Aquihabitans sp. McL0605]|uniref:class I SAM-dependent methyltransferase n=1 Tax=Aquihabitans sp. McL0605 TaxID=3415671 RepID=UPI003CEAEBFB
MGANDGVQRSWHILQAMRREQADPRGTYTFMGDDTAELLSGYLPLEGAVAIDVGGGPGYTAEALRRAGAHAFTFDPFEDELSLHGRTPVDAVVGDGLALPLADGSVDLVCTLNALEHVETPWLFLDELVRVARRGGIVFIGVTNWLSPWGGHETSPWHYLGGERAARRYQARTGTPPKNRYGTSLFPIGVGEVLRWAHADPHVRVVDAFPRYYPRWCRPLVHVPGVREVVTWNLGLVLERT